MASSATADKRVLLLGFGNPGRRDDGLGPAAIEAAHGWNVPGISLDADYQLTVEDSWAVAQNDVVVFVDAAVDGPEPFSFLPVENRAQPGFSSHSVRPETVLILAEQLFGARVEAYMLGIRGYEFDEFGAGLSERARENLHSALRFIQPMLRRRDFTIAP
jgi:hydrogenase maturation protease